MELRVAMGENVNEGKPSRAGGTMFMKRICWIERKLNQLYITIPLASVLLAFTS